MAISKEDILEAVGSMTVMDLNDLVKAFEEKFGVSAAAMAVAGPGAGGAALRPPGAQSVAAAPKSVTPYPWRRRRAGPAADRNRLRCWSH